MHPKLRQMKINIKRTQLQIEPTTEISSERAFEMAVEFEETEKSLSPNDPAKLFFSDKRTWALDLASLMEEEEKEDDEREKASVG